MSAIANFRLDAAALVRQAANYDACDDYHVEAGESSQYCAGCGLTLTAHVVRALRERVVETCATCAHSNDGDSLLPSLNTYCTKRIGFFNGKLMPKTARCESWAKGPGHE